MTEPIIVTVSTTEDGFEVTYTNPPPAGYIPYVWGERPGFRAAFFRRLGWLLRSEAIYRRGMAQYERRLNVTGPVVTATIGAHTPPPDAA